MSQDFWIRYDNTWFNVGHICYVTRNDSGKVDEKWEIHFVSGEIIKVKDSAGNWIKDLMDKLTEEETFADRAKNS